MSSSRGRYAWFEIGQGVVTLLRIIKSRCGRACHIRLAWRLWICTRALAAMVLSKVLRFWIISTLQCEEAFAFCNLCNVVRVTLPFLQEAASMQPEGSNFYRPQLACWRYCFPSFTLSSYNLDPLLNGAFNHPGCVPRRIRCLIERKQQQV